MHQFYKFVMTNSSNWHHSCQIKATSFPDFIPRSRTNTNSNGNIMQEAGLIRPILAPKVVPSSWCREIFYKLGQKLWRTRLAVPHSLSLATLYHPTITSLLFRGRAVEINRETDKGCDMGDFSRDYWFCYLSFWPGLPLESFWQVGWLSGGRPTAVMRGRTPRGGQAAQSWQGIVGATSGQT